MNEDNKHIEEEKPLRVIVKETYELAKETNDAVVGRPELGQEGLVRRMKKAEAYIQKDRKQKWYAAGFVGALILFKDQIIHFVREAIF